MLQLKKLNERPKAMVCPSGETAGKESVNNSEGGSGEVKLRVSPVSIDNSIKPFVTTHLPSGNQANNGPSMHHGRSVPRPDSSRYLSHASFWPADRGDDNEGRSLVHYPDKAYGSSIRAKKPG